MLARTHLMRLQRTLYDRLKGHARDIVGNLRPDLRKYFLEYQREFTEIKGLSNKQELLSAVQESQVAICGDYHTLAQAQRTVIRLLRESLESLRARGRRVVLALEMIRFRDTPHVAEYLAGRRDETDFLRAIGFRKNWGFNWDNYRQLFDFAREHGIPVVGINSDARGRPASLRERDRFAAQVLGSLLEKDPGITVMALIGDLHLAGPHLPAALKRELARRNLQRTVTVIHQNHERLYWKLAARKLEQKVDVVKLRDGVFCVMNTPPWVKLQSYLSWHELVADPDLDLGDEIREFVAIIREFLELAPEVDDDFKLVSPGDLGFLDRISEEKRISRAALRCLARCLCECESLFIPPGNYIFLTSLSLNQTAAQASIYLHAKLGGGLRVFENPRVDFYPQLWVEAIGFLGSKIINPHRKCAGPSDLLAMTRAGRRGAAKVAALVLRHLRAERNGRLRGFALPSRAPTPQTAALFHQAARRLGHCLGQGIYGALIEGAVSRDEVRALFQHDFFAADAKALYLAWIRRLDAGEFRAGSTADSL